VAVGAVLLYAGVATFAIIKAVDFVLGLRVPEHEEEVGLDLAVHGEAAYQL
jgi:Amt family ammonium transporter